MPPRARRAPAGAFGVVAPRQRRSERSWERVLDAGVRILARRGYEGFTVAELCAEAGVGTGSIYARVPSKEALIHVISQRETERFVAEIDHLGAGFAGRSRELPAYVRELIATLITPAIRESDLTRALWLRAASDPVVDGFGREMEAVTRHWFVAGLRARAAEIRRPDREHAINLCFEILVATLGTRLTAAPQPGRDEADSWDEYVTELGDMFAAYLASPAGD